MLIQPIRESNALLLKSTNACVVISIYVFCSFSVVGFNILFFLSLFLQFFCGLNLNAYFDFLLLPEISLFITHTHTHYLDLHSIFSFLGCCRTRAGYSRGDQFYAAYPAGTELLTDATKVCDQ